MKSRSRGFTIVELMVTLSIAALILAIGAPSFNEFRRNNRLTGTANDFLGAVQTARTEAIKRQLQVSVCPSANPNDASPTCTNGAFTGWIAFVDPDGNCVRNGAAVPDPMGGAATRETDDINLVRAGGPIETQVTVVSAGTCVSFAPTGFLQAVPGRVSSTRTMFCDDRGTALQGGTNLSVAREIQVTNVGRSRITRLPAELADASLGAALDCP